MNANKKIFITDIPFPPTSNHRYKPRRGRLVLSDKTRSYKDLIKMHLFRNYRHLDASDFIGKTLKIEIDYIGKRSFWFTKKNKIKQIDVDNRHKSILDGIFPFISLNDSQAFSVTLNKIVSDDYKEVLVNVTISEMELS